MVRGRTEREETGLVGGQTARRDCGSTWWSLRKRCGHVPTTYTPLLSAIYILAFSGISASHVLSAVLPSTSTVRHGSHGQEGQESGPSREPQQRREQRHRPAHQFPLSGQHVSRHHLPTFTTRGQCQYWGSTAAKGSAQTAQEKYDQTS